MSEADARKYIAELFKIVGTDSILVVLHTGHVKRLYCPFIVVCKADVSTLQKGREYTVTSIKLTLSLKDVFIIDGWGYYVWYFTIKV
jgi:hypothetical protein